MSSRHCFGVPVIARHPWRPPIGFAFAVRNVAVIALVLGAAAVANAQWDPPPVTLPVTEGADLRFDHLPLGIDPSHRRITAIVQDDLAFLWVGTDDGLERYDAYRIRDFRHDPKNPDSFPDCYIVTLIKDRLGRLWGASGRYLDVCDPATEKSPPVRADQLSPQGFTARVGETQPGSRGHDLVIDRQGPVRGGPCRGGARPTDRSASGDLEPTRGGYRSCGSQPQSPAQAAETPAAPVVAQQQGVLVIATRKATIGLRRGLIEL